MSADLSRCGRDRRASRPRTWRCCAAGLAETNKGVVALYADLDDKALQLRDAADLKSRFLSYMSHEFRTPLTSITSLTNVLLARLDGPLTSRAGDGRLSSSPAPP